MNGNVIIKANVLNRDVVSGQVKAALYLTFWAYDPSKFYGGKLTMA